MLNTVIGRPPSGQPQLHYRCEQKRLHTDLGNCYLASRPKPNPIPTTTLTVTPTLWGVRGRQGRSRGSAECFVRVFPKLVSGPKGGPQPIRHRCAVIFFHTNNANRCRFQGLSFQGLREPYLLNLLLSEMQSRSRE